MGKQVGKVREFKSFAFKLDAPPDDEGRFSGSAAVFGNVDKGNDVIEPGATTKTIQESPEVPIFWVHEYELVPIGIGTLSTDGKKSTRIEGQLFIETSELAREVFGAMKAGAVKGLSVGYNAIKRYFKGAVRHLQEIAIGEVSLCPFPMNPLAEVDSVKMARKYGWPVDDEVQDVSCLLGMISYGVDFMDNEGDEGDGEDVAAMAQILSLIVDLLSVEVAEVGQPDDDADEDETPAVDVEVYVETMREPVHFAIKKLQALLEREPAKATRQVKRAATKGNAPEPDVSTLRALVADIKSAA